MRCNVSSQAEWYSGNPPPGLTWDHWKAREATNESSAVAGGSRRKWSDCERHHLLLTLPPLLAGGRAQARNCGGAVAKGSALFTETGQRMWFDKSWDCTPAAASSGVEGCQFTPECSLTRWPGVQWPALASASFSHQATGSTEHLYKPVLQFRRCWARAGTRLHCYQIMLTLWCLYTARGSTQWRREAEWHGRAVPHPAPSMLVQG